MTVLYRIHISGVWVGSETSLFLNFPRHVFWALFFVTVGSFPGFPELLLGHMGADAAPRLPNRVQKASKMVTKISRNLALKKDDSTEYNP